MNIEAHSDNKNKAQTMNCVHFIYEVVILILLFGWICFPNVVDLLLRIKETGI